MCIININIKPKTDTFISDVIAILELFGTLVPRNGATVKIEILKQKKIQFRSGDPLIISTELFIPLVPTEKGNAYKVPN